MMNIESIRQKLGGVLPGQEAQFRMAHIGRERLEDWPLPETYRKAAVLLLLYPETDGKMHFVLIRRTAGWAHSRQVGFPGGGIEEQDNGSMLMAALRETHEEIGVPRNQVTVLGELSPLWIPVSGNMVFPFVGYVPEKPSFIPDPSEVEEVLTVPLERLFEASVKKITSLTIEKGFVLPNVPYWDLADHVVWGATAMMLSEFEALITHSE